MALSSQELALSLLGDLDHNYEAGGRSFRGQVVTREDAHGIRRDKYRVVRGENGLSELPCS